MNMKVIIASFTGPNAFLSNFFPCPIRFEGETYPSVEHAYQAAKTLDPKLRIKIRDTMTMGAAKKAGRKLPLRPDWEEKKIHIMTELLHEKFGIVLKGMLEATGDTHLIEGNNWGDQFWGCTLNPAGEWVGLNMLGKLLMEVRDTLKRINKT